MINFSFLDNIRENLSRNSIGGGGIRSRGLLKGVGDTGGTFQGVGDTGGTLSSPSGDTSGDVVAPARTTNNEISVQPPSTTTSISHTTSLSASGAATSGPSTTTISQSRSAGSARDRHNRNSYEIDEDVEKLHSSSENLPTIKVAYPVFGKPMSYIEDGKPAGLNFKIWNSIYTRLEKNGYKTNVEYVIITKPNTEQLVEDLKSRKYDIIVGNYGTNPQFLNSVSYTLPYMSLKDVGVYKDEHDIQFEYRLVRNLISVLYYPFIVLVALSLLSAVYARLSSRNSTLSGSFVQMMNGLLGDRGGLLTGTSFRIRPGKSFFVWILAIIVIIVSFLFLFYLQSIAISKSLYMISKSKDPFIHPRGKKVLVPKGSTSVKNLRDCCGIKTVETKTNKKDVSSIAEEFDKRRKKEKLIGFYHTGPEVIHWLKKNSEYVVSDTPFSVPSPVSFMVSRYNPELLNEINKVIVSINWKAELTHTCEQYIDRQCFSSHYEV